MKIVFPIICCYYYIEIKGKQIFKIVFLRKEDVNDMRTVWKIWIVTILCLGSCTTLAASGTVKAKENHQTMIGFGASIAWYTETLANHPQKGAIYDLIFNDLGLDILRLRNNYGKTGGVETSVSTIISDMNMIAYEPPLILMSSWSPPWDLKSNLSVNGGSNATLKKENNKFVYGKFAAYWVDALTAYGNAGIEPDYISMQNEPSFDAQWESCRFDAGEGTVAGYGKALDTLRAALDAADLHPKLLAPEIHGIGYNTPAGYISTIHKNIVDGYDYHLYHGNSGTNDADNVTPDGFNASLTSAAAVFSGKPIWQTEFDRGDWFQTVWVMHNCLVNGNVSAYLWWELIWGEGSKPLITLSSTGYTINKYYWAFRQYSRYISAGWNRVTATSTDDSLRMSAFASPGGDALTIVILNIGRVSRSMDIVIQDFTVSGVTAIRTSDTEQGKDVSASYTAVSPMEFPAHSVTTLAFTGTLVTSIESPASVPADFVLNQNYPNPFNPITTISYALPVQSKVNIEIFTVMGQKIATVVDQIQPAGTYTARFDASMLGSGVYVYRMVTPKFMVTRKMTLVK
jgi:glucuronoarabinoxylan endo-1,4-beta-xylanase